MFSFIHPSVPTSWLLSTGIAVSRSFQAYAYFLFFHSLPNHQLSWASGLFSYGWSSFVLTPLDQTRIGNTFVNQAAGQHKLFVVVDRSDSYPREHPFMPFLFFLWRSQEALRSNHSVFQFQSYLNFCFYSSERLMQQKISGKWLVLDIHYFLIEAKA